MVITCIIKICKHVRLGELLLSVTVSHRSQMKAHAKGKKISYEKMAAIATGGVGRCW